MKLEIRLLDANGAPTKVLQAMTDSARKRSPVAVIAGVHATMKALGYVKAKDYVVHLTTTKEV